MTINNLMTINDDKLKNMQSENEKGNINNGIEKYMPQKCQKSVGNYGKNWKSPFRGASGHL